MPPAAPRLSVAPPWPAADILAEATVELKRSPTVAEGELLTALLYVVAQHFARVTPFKE